MISIHTINVSHAQRPALTPAPIPQDKYFNEWVLTTLKFADIDYPCEINIRTVEIEEMSQLNEQYRHKQGPTNVLSFPLMQYDAQKNLPMMGDIVICSPVILIEAEKQHKQLLAHWAHMTVHGTLHLLGYTHDNSAQAVIMENLEITILTSLGFLNPYLSTKRVCNE